MQKKVIIPLLMTVPAALPAMADIAMGFPNVDGWEKTGVTDENWIVNPAEHSISCVVGTGSVSTKFAGLPTGKYQFKFTTANNIRVSVTVNGGAPIEILNNAGEANDVATNEFAVNEGDTVVMTVEASNNSIGFGFTARVLCLKVTEAQYNDIKSALDAVREITLKDVTAEDDFQEAVDLRARKATLEGEIAAYNGKSFGTSKTETGTVLADLWNLATGPESLTSEQKLLKLYKAYGLDKTPATLLTYLQNLKGSVEQYNMDVDAEDAIWVRYTENVATRTTLLGEQATLLTNAKAVLESVENYQVVDPALKAKLLADAQNLVKEIEAYGVAINAAYPDPAGPDRRKLREEIEFESRNTELTGSVTDLQDEFNNFKADYEAYYNVNFLELSKLKEAYDAYVKVLKEAKGVAGYEKIYDNIVSISGDNENPSEGSLLLMASELYTTTKDNNQIENVDGAAEAASEKVVAIEAAIASFNHGSDAFKTLVETQNGYMEAALTSIAGYQTKVSEYKTLQIPTQFKTEFDAKLQDIEAAINAFQDYVDEHYDKHDLTDAGLEYQDLKSDIETKLSDMDTFLEPVQVVMDLYQKLLAAQEVVAQLGSIDVENGDKTESVNFADRFNSTFEGLKVAIFDLTLEEAADTNITGPIEDQIEKYQANAEKYADNFMYAQETINSFTATINELSTFITDKIFDDYKDAYNTDLQALKTEYQNILNTGNNTGKNNFKPQVAKYLADLYNAAIVENDQQSFDQIAALVEALNNEFMLEDLKHLKDEFAKKGTDANMAFANTRLADFKTALANAVADGVTKADEIDTTDIEAEFDSLEQKIDLANGANDKPAELANCDTDIVTALDKLQLLIDTLATYQKNQDNYDDLTTGMTLSVAALNLSLDELRAYNVQTSMTPGKEYYIDNVFPGLQEKIDNLNTELETALQDIKLATDEEKAAFEVKIKAIADDIAAAKAAIKANNDNHNAQLDKEREERTHAESVLTQIATAIEQDGSGDLTLVKEWQKELNDIINNDIVNENIVVTQAYGKGESAKQNDAIMAVYDDIHMRIQAIEDALNGDAYSQAIIDANAETTQGWSAITGGLWNTWKNAIKEYNYFYYDLNNEGWKNYIHDEVERHYPEFQYYEVIAAIISEQSSWLAQQNASKHVITPEEWQVWLDKAATTTSDINGHVANLIVKMTEMAETYYGLKSSEGENAISDAKAALIAAGIEPAGYLEAASGYLAAAEGMYNAAVTADNLAKSMDDIANELDKVVPSIDLQKFCEDAWSKEYAAAQAEIANMREEITAARFADPEVVAAEMQGFEAYVTSAAEINTEAVGVKSGLVEVYAGYSDSLDALLENMRKVVKRIQKSSDLNEENQNIFNNYTDIWAPNMENQYEALKKYCEALGGSGDMQPTLNNIRGAIDALAGLVETHMGSLNEQDIEGRYNNIMAAIENAYKTASETEIACLRKLRLKAQTAFNDAIVKSEGKLTQRLAELGSDYTEWTIEQAISKMSDKIESMHYDAADKEAFKKEALGYETELCNIYNLLQSTWTDSPATAVKAGLDGIYNRIDKAIADGQEYLDGCLDDVKTEYADSYKELKDKLDAEKAAWDANGPEVIAHEGAYKRHLSEIENDVNALASEIKAAQQAALDKAEKERVNNERYAALKADWDALNAEFEAAKALVASYENGISESLARMAQYIANQLTYSLKTLEDAHTAVSLTADSELQDAASIASNINDYKMYGTKAYAYVQFNTIDAKDTDLRGKLQSLHIVPDVYAEIIASLNTLSKRAGDLKDEVRGADFDRLNEIIEEAKGIIESYDSLLDQAVENSYIPGDVNMDGKVNVLDVQTLIDLIGEGVTYADLYAENPREACAADVTGDNAVNIADVTSIIDIILGQPYQMTRVSSSMPMNKAMADASMRCELIGEEDNVRHYALMLSNPMAFTAGQFEIQVSGDSRVAEVMTAERTEGYEASLYELSNGGARVVLYNMDNRAFNGTEGVIVYIDVEGKGSVTVSEAVFSDVNHRAHTVANAHSSAVDAIVDGIKDGVEKIWDVAGRSMKKLQRGINIIRHKDGSVTKEIRK